MSRAVKVAISALAISFSSSIACLGQSEGEIQDAIENQQRQLRQSQAKFKELSETGVRLFGRKKNPASDPSAKKIQIDRLWSTLDLKHPENYHVGDWGSPGTQTAVFRVVQRVADDALLISSKRGTMFWLQGVDPGSAAEGMEFMLPVKVAITGTKTYDSVSGASRTALVMEADPEKVLRHAELAQNRDKEAGWRVWTITKTIKRTASKPAPNVIAPKAKAKVPPQSKQTRKIMAQFVEAKGGKITLLNRWGFVEGGYGEQRETVLLKELSAEDRAYVSERAKGPAKSANAQPPNETAKSPAEPTSVTPSGDMPTAGSDSGTPGDNDRRTRWLNESYNTTVRYVDEKKV